MLTGGRVWWLQALNNDPLEKYCDDNPDADECR
jgi:hypothetical protein